MERLISWGASIRDLTESVPVSDTMTSRHNSHHLSREDESLRACKMFRRTGSSADSLNKIHTGINGNERRPHMHRCLVHKV